MSSKVLAFIAIFIALSGSSYAAIKLKPNSVTSRTVKDGSLLKRDFKPGVLPAATRVTAASGAAGPAGPQGEKGDKGDPGERGPSEARSVYRLGVAKQIGGALTTVATLDLEPGAYLIEAKLVAIQVGKTAVPVLCELHAGSAKDETVGQVGQAPFYLQLTTTLDAAGPATLECKTAGNLQIAAVGDLRLTAVRLGRETSSEL